MTTAISNSISAGLPPPGSNRGYQPEQLIKQMMHSVWCGGNRFEDAEVTRFDQVLGSIFGIHRMAHFKAITPLFGKCAQTVNDALLKYRRTSSVLLRKVRCGFPDLTVSLKTMSRFRFRCE